MRSKKYNYSKYPEVNEYLDKRRISISTRYTYAKTIDLFLDWKKKKQLEEGK